MAAHRCAAVIAALFTLSGAAAAQDVTLTARGGGLTLTGDLRGYDGEFYRIATEFGELTVDAQGVSCAGPGCPNLTDYVAEATIAGSATMGLTLLSPLLSDYAAERGYRLAYGVADRARISQVLRRPVSGDEVLRLDMRLSTSEAGLAALAAGEAGIAMSQREVPENPRGRVVALDALVPMVARGNPVTAIALDDLAGVLSGAITDWGEIGGPPGAPVRVHGLAQGSGLQMQLRSLLFPGHRGALSVAVRHDAPADLADAVARDPDALGVGLYSDPGAARILPLSGACGYRLVATPNTLKSEDYPLPAPYLLYTPPRRLPLELRRFLDHLGTPSAHRAIRGAGFVDLSPVETGIGGQGARLANAIAAAGPEVDLAELQRMAALMKQVRRLSVTFRFRDGSAALDTQSRGNLADLARALESGASRGTEMILVGFSDGAGAAAANRTLALRRAETVRDALLGTIRLPQAAMPAIAVESFGEALPIACDDTALGRRVNRRVEVWLR